MAKARFHKIISQENIDENRLRLPPKLVRKFRNELSDIATLKVFDGLDWLMEIKREGEDICFETGFYGFSRYYSLSHGHLLQFEYMGMSTFTVHIFDLSSCEITYPSLDGNADDASDSPPNEIPRGYTSGTGVLSPRHFKSRKPYFDVKLKEYNFENNVLYLDPEVARVLREKPARGKLVQLRLGDGRQWTVSLLRKKNGRFNFGRMTAFYADNNLKEGDVCIFELVKKNVFKVYLFHAV